MVHRALKDVRPHNFLKGKTPREFGDSMAGLY